MNIKSNKPSKDALLEVFGTPRPADYAVYRWKSSWRNSTNRVKVSSYTDALSQLKCIPDIDPLFYQFITLNEKYTGNSQSYVVFFKEEHEAYFKMCQYLD